MVDQGKAGTHWEDGELDVIVADYFAMLNAEQAGQAYVKARHSKELISTLGRSHRSVEFKHMNISAVLSKLGMPIIRGYKPAFNVQFAIYDAIDRYLSMDQAATEHDPTAISGVAEVGLAHKLFVEPPPVANRDPSIRIPRLERLVRKFDPTERDFRNRALGKAGEALVVDFERYRLEHAERRDLAGKVRWVSEEDGDGAGYDILSFDASGNERLIEVKTTCGVSTTPFFITGNERALSEERPKEFRIFRIYDYGPEPKVFKLHPPIEEAVCLEPTTYRASFR